MTLMFMGPFSVYLAGLLGIRRVLLCGASIFILASILLPFSPNLAVMLALQVVAGLSAGAFYTLTMPYALRTLPLRYTGYAIRVYFMAIHHPPLLSGPLQALFRDHLSCISLVCVVTVRTL